MTIRSFFAIDIEAKEIQEKIRKTQKELDDPTGRMTFVAPENLHLTLKFLGNIEEGIVSALQQEAEQLTRPKFTITFQGLGSLPSLNYINAIFVGITEGQKELQALAKDIDTFCQNYNVKKEKRAYKAHLTIGRVKRIGKKQMLIEKIIAKKDEPFGNYEVTNVKLKKSELGPSGPTYTDLFEIALE